jgi:hypothetical protein
MHGIRVMAGLLTVLIGGSISEGSAQGLGANQQGGQGAASSYLSLDGLAAGQLGSVEQTQTAAGFDLKLSIAPLLMSPLFYTTWFGPALQGQKPLKTVRITTFSRTAAGSSNSAQEATGVAPRQIDLPTLDAGSHETIKFSVSFSAPGMHPVQPGSAPTVNQYQTHLVASNFRLNFQGNPLLDGSHVSKIEAISIGPRGAVPALAGPAMKSQAVGGKSFAPEIRNLTGPGGVAISNLVFYIAQAYAVPFQQWLATSPNQTRNGSITYLRQNMTPWGTLDLKGLAITKITTETNPGQEGIRKVRVEMTVGSLQLTLAP